MKYTIKDILEKHKELNKSFIYDIIKSNKFDISYNFRGNRRLFTDKDVEIFLYTREEGNIKGLEKHGIKQIQTVGNNLEEYHKEGNIEVLDELIKENNIIEKNEVSSKIIKENEKLKIIDKENQELLKVREEMSQKYALLYKEERKDKEAMLEEKEKERQERLKIQKDFNIISNRYNIFKILFIILLCILIISILINMNILTFNIN